MFVVLVVLMEVVYLVIRIIIYKILSVLNNVVLVLLLFKILILVQHVMQLVWNVMEVQVRIVYNAREIQSYKKDNVLLIV